MEIAKIENNQLELIQSMSVAQKPFILALIDSRIAILDQEDGVGSCFEILKRAELDSGLTKIENTDLVALGFSSWELINSDYKGLTVAEFKLACKYGVLNAYGEWYGICLKTVNQWILGYLECDERKRALQDWNKKLESSEIKTRQTSEIQKVMFSKQGCINAFQKYKDHKAMPFGAHAYYDIINEFIGTDHNGIKTLVVDSEARKAIVKEWTEKHTKDMIRSKLGEERKGNLQGAEALMGSVTADFKNDSTLNNVLKREFLKYYWNKLITEGKEMEL